MDRNLPRKPTYRLSTLEREYPIRVSRFRDGMYGVTPLPGFVFSQNAVPDEWISKYNLHSVSGETHNVIRAAKTYRIKNYCLMLTPCYCQQCREGVVKYLLKNDDPHGFYTDWHEKIKRLTSESTAATTPA